MDTTIDRFTPAPATTPATRMELYTPIHKALRAPMGHTLEVADRADPADAQELPRAPDEGAAPRYLGGMLIVVTKY